MLTQFDGLFSAWPIVAQELDVSGISLEPMHLVELFSFPHALFRNINELQLANVNLDDQGVELLCAALVQHPSILSLNLAKNRISSSGAQQVCTFYVCFSTAQPH